MTDLATFEAYIPAQDRALWNQSFYFNAYDPVTRTGCFLRVGFMEGLGKANSWMVFFRDGKPMFQRFNADLACPAERLADGVTLGDLTLVSEEPLRRARVRFQSRTFSFDLVWQAMHPMIDAVSFSRATGEGTGDFASSMAHAHLEGSCVVEGEIVLRGERSAFSGTGARDVAAGVRDWTAMEHYRVAWPIFPDGTAMIGIHGISGGRSTYMSMLHDGTDWRRITRTQDGMRFADDAMTVRESSWSFGDEDGRDWSVTARPLFRTFLPADDYVLAEHIAEFTRQDGMIGYGLVECGYRLPWPD